MCYSLWYKASTMLPAGSRLATSWVLYTTSGNTQSSAPEDGRNYRPKHVELIGIINKLLLLHLVGCLHYLQASQSIRTHISTEDEKSRTTGANIHV